MSVLGEIESVNEAMNDVTNGFDEPMETDGDVKMEQFELKEVTKPGRIVRRPRPSNSSASSGKSGWENAGQGESDNAADKHGEPDSEEDEDFLGFPGPADTSARDLFHAFVGKEADASIADDDVRSLASEDIKSEKSDNDDSDSESPSIRPWRKSVTRRSVSSDKTSEKQPADNRKPLEQGWTREVVYRLSGTSSNKRRADIYYYTPAGKKIRSLADISDHLTGDLTLDHFTFSKVPLGLDDPKKEIVREARSLKQAEENSSQKQQQQQQQQKSSTQSAKSKPKGLTETQVKSPATPKVSLKSANKKSAGKKPESIRKSAVQTYNSENDDSEEGDWNVVQKNPTREVCSIECRLAMGLIPTLQCVSCLCLYHPECVGIQHDKLSPSKPYSCKNCQTDSGQAQSKAVSGANQQAPPLTPLPPSNNPTTPRKYGPKSDPKTNHSRQNIVGTVTTWLPSSSSIQVSQSSPTPKTSTTSTTVTTTPTSSTKPSTSDGPHQGLLEMGGNTFVVIPRHNVVNVSNQTSSAPAVAATANATNAVSTVNPQTQTNGILLVPLSVQPPDSTLAEVPAPKAVNSGATVEANGLKPRASDLSTGDEPRNFKLKEVPPKYQRNRFFALSDATTMSLFSFFQYLKVHELLRATQVNKTWNLISTHQSLWETVRMKNSKVRDFVGFGNALRRYNTKSLDLRKMITPESPEATNEMWTELGSVISTLPNLKRVDFGRCSPSAIEVVASACSHLESITSLSIRGNELNMSPIACCQNLVELKLKSFGGFDAKNFKSLSELTKLKTLVLTSVRNLEGIEQALPASLETLELGECVKLHESFATVALPRLANLKRLRLEKGQGTMCPTLAMLQTISSLPNLAQLELINFDIKPGFDKALSKCTNVKILLIIPTYVTQSATTNHVVMGGVSKLSGSLQYFIWGLTLELLRVTDLFIDQVEGGKSKSGGTASGKKTGTGDSIPILKPLSDEGAESNREGSASQVDILGLPKLQRVLSTLLPQTKIKILKIPFSATWRQTVSDVPV